MTILNHCSQMNSSILTYTSSHIFGLKYFCYCYNDIVTSSAISCLVNFYLVDSSQLVVRWSKWHWASGPDTILWSTRQSRQCTNSTWTDSTTANEHRRRRWWQSHLISPIHQLAAFKILIYFARVEKCISLKNITFVIVHT